MSKDQMDGNRVLRFLSFGQSAHTKTPTPKVERDSERKAVDADELTPAQRLNKLFLGDAYDEAVPGLLLMETEGVAPTSPEESILLMMAKSEQQAWHDDLVRRARRCVPALSEAEKDAERQYKTPDELPGLPAHRPREVVTAIRRRRPVAAWHRPRQDRFQGAAAATKAHVGPRGAPEAEEAYWIEWEQDGVLWKLAGRDERGLDGTKSVTLTWHGDVSRLPGAPIAVEWRALNAAGLERLTLTESNGSPVIASGQFGPVAARSYALMRAIEIDDNDAIQSLCPRLLYN